MASGYDLVIRNGTVATASDTMRCDIGVRGGRIAAFGEALERGREEVDAAGLVITPGGVDGHCHFEQALPDGAELADDFLTGTRSAACGVSRETISSRPDSFWQKCPADRRI